MLVVAALVAAIWAYPQLPAQIPTRWNWRGEVDGYGPPAMIFLIGPGLMALQMALFAILPRLAPRRFEIESFLETWLDMLLILVAMNGYFFVVLLIALLGPGLDLDRAIFGGVALVVALLGNLMGKVRRNFFIGIRTPWTLASARVWDATHRVAARGMVAAGVCGIVIVLAAWPTWWVVAVVIVAFVVPVLYSLWLYRRLLRQGGLEEAG